MHDASCFAPIIFASRFFYVYVKMSKMRRRCALPPLLLVVADRKGAPGLVLRSGEKSNRGAKPLLARRGKTQKNAAFTEIESMGESVQGGGDDSESKSSFFEGKNPAESEEKRERIPDSFFAKYFRELVRSSMGEYDCTQNRAFLKEYTGTKFPPAALAEKNLLNKMMQELPSLDRQDVEKDWNAYKNAEMDSNVVVIWKAVEENALIPKAGDEDALQDIGALVCVVPPEVAALAHGDESPWDEHKGATYWEKLVTDFRASFLPGHRPPMKDHVNSLSMWTLPPPQRLAPVPQEVEFQVQAYRCGFGTISHTWVEIQQNVADPKKGSSNPSPVLGLQFGMTGIDCVYGMPDGYKKTRGWKTADLVKEYQRERADFAVIRRLCESTLERKPPNLIMDPRLRKLMAQGGGSMCEKEVKGSIEYDEGKLLASGKARATWHHWAALLTVSFWYGFRGGSYFLQIPPDEDPQILVEEPPQALQGHARDAVVPSFLQFAPSKGDLSKGNLLNKKEAKGGVRHGMLSAGKAMTHVAKKGRKFWEQKALPALKEASRKAASLLKSGVDHGKKFLKKKVSPALQKLSAKVAPALARLPGYRKATAASARVAEEIAGLVAAAGSLKAAIERAMNGAAKHCQVFTTFLMSVLPLGSDFVLRQDPVASDPNDKGWDWIDIPNKTNKGEAVVETTTTDTTTKVQVADMRQNPNTGRLTLVNVRKYLGTLKMP
ncbi:unnamed protein product [Amoebophrya sp. A25]|nr:unnamed protein product [Amoebophrya sp. A25]|eukprot:GSA25T00002600001.1